MFWIGFIVGIISLLALVFACFVFCMCVTGTTWEEFQAVVMANADAFGNRESVMQVWHDGELLNEVTLEEK